MDLVLCASNHPPPQRLGGGAGDPDRVEHAGRQQAGQGACIEAVRLDAGMGDRPDVLGVGDDHPGDVGLEDPGDLHRRPSRLHDHLVVRAEALSEEVELDAIGLDPARGLTSPPSQIATSQKLW